MALTRIAGFSCARPNECYAKVPQQMEGLRPAFAVTLYQSISAGQGRYPSGLYRLGIMIYPAWSLALQQMRYGVFTLSLYEMGKS